MNFIVSREMLVKLLLKCLWDKASCSDQDIKHYYASKKKPTIKRIIKVVDFNNPTVQILSTYAFLILNFYEYRVINLEDYD